jgi:outer membrane protein OmpU
MKNLKKLGLSALAGSLVAFSASAVEMSVSGTSEITYTTGEGNIGTTANPWGSNTSLVFSGSGNVGWADVTIVRSINDGLGSAFLSAYQTMDMGDMGTLSFDAIGGGVAGLIPFDDKLPSAYEEVWNGMSGTGMAGAASNDTIGYSNTVGGVAFSLAKSRGGTAASSDGSLAEATGSDGSTNDWHLSYDVPGMDGLTLMHGRSEKDNTTGDNDSYQNSHILYSVGMISAGIRRGKADSGTAGVATHNVEAMSVAFNVNDNLSVSLATQDYEYDNASTADVTETVDAINASYTVGAASVRATIADGSNMGGNTAHTSALKYLGSGVACTVMKTSC